MGSVHKSVGMVMGWRGAALHWGSTLPVPRFAPSILGTPAMVVVPCALKQHSRQRTARPCSFLSEHRVCPFPHVSRLARSFFLKSHAPQTAREAHVLSDHNPLGNMSSDGLVWDGGGAQKRIVLLDVHAILYRAYFKLVTQVTHGGLKDMGSEGDWVLTVFTALSTILRLMDLNPTHVAAVFDFKGLTFRHEMYADYKKTRPPTPDTVLQAHDCLKPALHALGMTVLEVPGVEADDVIGTIALKAVATGMKVRIVSTDKDFFQLLSPPVRLLRFVPKGSGIVSFGVEEFSEKFGNIQPSQFVDVLALTGDRVDNIPGAEGIGEKTALTLIEQFGSVEKLLEERDSVALNRAHASLLLDEGELLLYKRLLALRVDLPEHMIPSSLDHLACRNPEDGGDKFKKLLEAMGRYAEPKVSDDLHMRAGKLGKAGQRQTLLPHKRFPRLWKGGSFTLLHRPCLLPKLQNKLLYCHSHSTIAPSISAISSFEFA